MDFNKGIAISPLIDYMDGADVDNWMLEGSQDLSVWELIVENNGQERLDTQAIIPNSSSGSTGLELTGSKQNKGICEDIYQQLSVGEGKTLEQLITQKEFEEKDLLHAFTLFRDILSKYPYIFLAWLAKVYDEVYADDEILTRLLTIIAEFADRQDFSYIASLFAKAELNNRSYEVVDIALSVIDNLPQENALRLMETIKQPADILLRMKYNDILNDLKQ